MSQITWTAPSPSEPELGNKDGKILATLTGLEASVDGLIGWMGGKNATASCTTDACSVVVYGRGFVALPNNIPNDVYIVTATIRDSSTTMDCSVNAVTATYLRCTISGFQSPPARQFGLSLAVTEAGQPFPYIGAAGQSAQMLQMTAVGPTINLGGVLFLSYSSNNGAQMSHTQPIAIADPDHPDSQLTVTFSSNNAGVLPGYVTQRASTLCRSPHANARNTH